jgi:hypothetical protein
MEPFRNHSENTWTTTRKREIKKLKQSSHIGHSTYSPTAEFTNVKLQNIERGKFQILISIKSTYPRNMVFRHIIVNTLH